MSDIDEATGVPEPARVESWLRTLIGFEDARVVTVEALTDGLSNVTCRVKLTDAPVAAAVLRIQPRRGIFEPYNILREGEVLKHLAGTAVPVPGVLASESDPRFFGAPFLLLEAIDAAHMPAPEADFDTFAADLPAVAAAVAAIHAIDWRAVGLDLPRRTEFGRRRIQGRGRSRCAAHVGVRLRRRAAAEPSTDGVAGVYPERRPTGSVSRRPNPFNYLFRGQQLVGVVDWEQALISDPRSDIGQLVSLSHLRGAAPYGPPSENLIIE